LIETPINNLTINKLSKKRYERLRNEEPHRIDPTAIYVTPELDVLSKTFRGEQGLGNALIEVAEEMLSADARECTILLTDHEYNGELPAFKESQAGGLRTAIAKMYRHTDDRNGEVCEHFPTQIYCGPWYQYTMYINLDETGVWSVQQLRRTQRIHSGSTPPESYLGNDGDIYIMYAE
jgi:hypothetical protein